MDAARGDALMPLANGSAKLCVLVLTNHFRNFAGSEVVALQMALGFAAVGDVVTLAANVIDEPMAGHALGISLTTDVADLDLTAFDLIWCQHDMLSLLPIAAFEKASAVRLPHIAFASLSPYEPYEHLNGALVRALSAEVYANSPETAAAVLTQNHGVLSPDDVQVFHNAAPAEFWRWSAARAPSAHLGSVLFVSNHSPQELNTCAAALAEQGIAVRRMGIGHEFALVGPHHIEPFDALVTIGKSVSYAIAMGKPVFMYDHFGGDGWLTRANFKDNLRHNFSGRPAMRRVSADVLTAEMMGGYESARVEAASLGAAFDLSGFRLDNHLSRLRQRALTNASPWRRWKLAMRLSQPGLRAHLEASRKKSEVMRKLGRQIEGCADQS